jgi:hypothetical protein
MGLLNVKFNSPICPIVSLQPIRWYVGSTSACTAIDSSATAGRSSTAGAWRRAGPLTAPLGLHRGDGL